MVVVVGEKCNNMFSLGRKYLIMPQIIAPTKILLKEQDPDFL